MFWMWTCEVSQSYYNMHVEIWVSLLIECRNATLWRCTISSSYGWISFYGWRNKMPPNYTRGDCKCMWSRRYSWWNKLLQVLSFHIYGSLSIFSYWIAFNFLLFPLFIWFTRTACVIAVAKARDTFEPFLHQVCNLSIVNIPFYFFIFLSNVPCNVGVRCHYTVETWSWINQWTHS